MARVLYGVHGTGRGHAMRASIVARHFAGHEFLFVSHGEAARLLRQSYRVLECDDIITQVRAHRVQLVPTVLRNAVTLARSGSLARSLEKAARSFHPDVAITDLEYLVPRVARSM